MRKIIPLLFFSALLCAVLAGAQSLGTNCADDCQSKITNCKASCAPYTNVKRVYRKCMDNCDDEWRECRKKCK